MSTAVVSGGVALLLNAQPSLTPGAGEDRAADGRALHADGGLVGGGAGSVNFPQSLKIAQNGPARHDLLTTVTSLLGLSSGATFRDNGTLIDRIYDRTGIRLLGHARSERAVRQMPTTRSPAC